MKIGRNDPCPCGSGKKYKKCHGSGSGGRAASQSQPTSRSFSTLDEHSREGKMLSPPLTRVPKMQPMSWASDRLPEMLWAALLVTHMPRVRALSVFRKLADRISSLPESERFGDVTHSGLAKSPAALHEVSSIIVAEEGAARTLTPLLLLENLPARERWQDALSRAESQLGWEGLMRAVALNLNHQSQEATDCRWLKVIATAASGSLHLPSSGFGPELGNEIENYPHYGDMAKVRPSIRAMEGAISCLARETSEWAPRFWKQCLRDTACFPLRAETLRGNVSQGSTLGRVREVYRQLIDHCTKTTTTTDVDARHDTVFGSALYCLALVEELLRIVNCQSVMARGALRTIVELYITLAYLIKKNDGKLWTSHRVFGAGQAKLVFLKLEGTGDRPAFVDLDTLQALANEDTWQEFLPINLGHWDKCDLRKMSEEAGVKDAYDKFYSWTSTYSHGHWCAVRDAVFDTCANPLHRLHRIPREAARALPDVIPDACELTDTILRLVSEAYPTFDARITLP